MDDFIKVFEAQITGEIIVPKELQHESFTIYVNGEEVGRVVDGKPNFDPVTVRAGDVVQLSRS
jgi:hypothetical protein